MRKIIVPETYSDVVGLFVHQLRRKKGVTQFDLGKAIDLSQSDVARIEGGQIKRITIITVVKLAKFFRMSPAQFVTEVDHRAKKAAIKP